MLEEIIMTHWEFLYLISAIIDRKVQREIDSLTISRGRAPPNNTFLHQKQVIKLVIDMKTKQGDGEVKGKTT